MRVTKIYYTTNSGKKVEFEIDPKDTQKLKEALLEASENAEIGTLYVMPEVMSDAEAEEWIEWSAEV